MKFAGTPALKCALAAAVALSILMPAAGHAQDAAALSQAQAPEGAIWLVSLDVGKMTSGWEGHPPLAGKSIEGRPLTLGGTAYPHGIGTHARSDMVIDLRGGARRF